VECAHVPWFDFAGKVGVSLSEGEGLVTVEEHDLAVVAYSDQFT
jgi:hypothetical protein